MTHRLGAGTCNLSVNVPSAWRKLIGRLAFTHDVTMGELLRRMIARAAHIWAAAKFAARAEQADLEAITVLKKALSDGIGPDDQASVEKAIALIENSARLDHAVRAGLDMEAAK